MESLWTGRTRRHRPTRAGSNNPAVAHAIATCPSARTGALGWLRFLMSCALSQPFPSSRARRMLTRDAHRSDGRPHPSCSRWCGGRPGASLLAAHGGGLRRLGALVRAVPQSPAPGGAGGSEVRDSLTALRRPHDAERKQPDPGSLRYVLGGAPGRAKRIATRGYEAFGSPSAHPPLSGPAA